MSKVVIGIDPDLHKSGVAVMVDGKLHSVESMPMFDVMEKLIILDAGNDVFVRIEDANMGRCSSWHRGGRGSVRDVGKNMAVATILREFCESKGIPHEMIPPAGYSHVFNDEKVFRGVTMWKGRTNKDSRAAVAMVWGYKAK